MSTLKINCLIVTTPDSRTVFQLNGPQQEVTIVYPARHTNWGDLAKALIDIYPIHYADSANRVIRVLDKFKDDEDYLLTAPADRMPSIGDVIVEVKIIDIEV